MSLKGFDILGLARYNAKELARTLPKKCAIGILMGTFGDPVKKLRVLLNTGKVKAVRVHLINTVCLRNGNCEAGEPSPFQWSALERRAKKIARLKVDFPTVHFFISPWLEHDVTDPIKVQEAIKRIKKVAKGCKIVISAHTGHTPANVLVEKHGNSSVKADIRSNDGADFFDAPASYKNAGTVLTLGWTPGFNLRKKSGPFVPPSKRLDSDRCSMETIKKMWELLQ